MQRQTLHTFLDNEIAEYGLDPKLSQLIINISETCKEISFEVSCGDVAGVLGVAGSTNVQGEVQKQLDVICNDLMVKGCIRSGCVCGMASEEMETALSVPAYLPVGPYLVTFDPLDGSSNIDINISISTLFSILPSPHGASHDISDIDFLQPGINQVAAGYVVYGPQTTMALTLGRGVVMFTLDPASNHYIFTKSESIIPRDAHEFAINCSNMRHWPEPVRRYITELLEGTTGPRGKDFNMRWIASMGAEVHRILSRGGIFMYPWDKRMTDRPGKLRLMYEANPMGFLIEQAGGMCTDGHGRVLEIQPEKLHQRIPVFLGAAEEVERVTRYITEAEAAEKAKEDAK